MVLVANDIHIARTAVGGKSREKEARNEEIRMDHQAENGLVAEEVPGVQA